MVFNMDFKKIQKLVHEEYKQKGFEERFNKAEDLLKPYGLDFIVVLAEVGLVSSEVGETLDWIRKDNEYERNLDLADIVIRVMTFCERKGIDLEKWILEKNIINSRRKRFHGKKNI